ncbi:MAG: hypothetical protein ABIX10_10995 [Acidimicrobiales bacterium]
MSSPRGLLEVEKEVRDAMAKHNVFLEKLGLDPLPSTGERHE